MNETAKYDAKTQPMTLSQDFASVLQIIEQNRLQAVQVIVSFEMTQIPSVLFRTGWTNHQIILNGCEQDHKL